MSNRDDVEDGIKERECAARLGRFGAMITEFPLEDRRYDQSEYEPFWAAAKALDPPLSYTRQPTVRPHGGDADELFDGLPRQAARAFINFVPHGGAGEGRRQVELAGLEVGSQGVAYWGKMWPAR